MAEEVIGRRVRLTAPLEGRVVAIARDQDEQDGDLWVSLGWVPRDQVEFLGEETASQDG